MGCNASLEKVFAEYFSCFFNLKKKKTNFSGCEIFFKNFYLQFVLEIQIFVWDNLMIDNLINVIQNQKREKLGKFMDFKFWELHRVISSQFCVITLPWIWNLSFLFKYEVSLPFCCHLNSINFTLQKEINVSLYIRLDEFSMSIYSKAKHFWLILHKSTFL